MHPGKRPGCKPAGDHSSLHRTTRRDSWNNTIERLINKNSPVEPNGTTGLLSCQQEGVVKGKAVGLRFQVGLQPRHLRIQSGNVHAVELCKAVLRGLELSLCGGQLAAETDAAGAAPFSLRRSLGSPFHGGYGGKMAIFENSPVGTKNRRYRKVCKQTPLPPYPPYTQFFRRVCSYSGRLRAGGEDGSALRPRAMQRRPSSDRAMPTYSK